MKVGLVAGLVVAMLAACVVEGDDERSEGELRESVLEPLQDGPCYEPDWDECWGPDEDRTCWDCRARNVCLAASCAVECECCLASVDCSGCECDFWPCFDCIGDAWWCPQCVEVPCDGTWETARAEALELMACPE